MGEQPIRPSVVDDVVVELTQIANEFRALEGRDAKAPEHKRHLEALEARAGRAAEGLPSRASSRCARARSACSTRSGC